MSAIADIRRKSTASHRCATAQQVQAGPVLPVAKQARNHSGAGPATRTARTEHCVEVFGGGRLKGDKCSRQFGSMARMLQSGRHSRGRVSLGCGGPALHEIDHNNLPRITRPRLRRSRRVRRAGGRPAGAGGVGADPGEGGTRVYDIDEETTRFEILGGGDRRLRRAGEGIGARRRSRTACRTPTVQVPGRLQAAARLRHGLRLRDRGGALPEAVAESTGARWPASSRGRQPQPDGRRRPAR